MAWAHIVNGVVVETTAIDPTGRFNVGLSWAACDGAVQQNYLATLAGSAWTFAPPPPPPPPAPALQISPLAFIGRFTPSEQTAIGTAAMGNVSLWLWFNKMTAATTIDLSDPQTKAGLDALVAAGLIAAGRETAILAP